MLDLDKGKELLELARDAIQNYLETGKKINPPEDTSGVMSEKRGVFVTLNKNGDLRGCIGRPLPTEPLANAVIDSAINAATQDPRFTPLQKDELKNITVEVSVLTVPEKIEVDTPSDYPDKVEVGKDGLIVNYMGNSGLLLPQVPVEQGWDAEEFISQTCVKAGISSDSWLEKDVEIECFNAQIFKEKEPLGEIVEEELFDDEGKTY